ncbi:MAG TPA: thioredoxin [Candidatus Gallacutalibacter stercoravium]|nr:thioredoxin [Candidatus Gallacutalibacter stercoravium]
MKIVELGKQNFSQEVLQAQDKVLIDFWADWCGPCRMLSPVVDEIAQEQEGNLKVCKVNVDKEPELAQQFGVMSIPTLVVMKDGKVVSSSVGVQPKAAILRMVEKD